MNKFKRNKKAIALILGLAAMLTAPSAHAQGVFGDMLDNYYAEKESSSNSAPLLRGDYTISGNTEEGISNYGIGQSVPLGSGLAILLTAGLGYVALKKKEDEQ